MKNKTVEKGLKILPGQSRRNVNRYLDEFEVFLEEGKEKGYTEDKTFKLWDIYCRSK